MTFQSGICIYRRLQSSPELLGRLPSFALTSRSSPPLYQCRVSTVNLYPLFFVGNSTLNRRKPRSQRFSLVKWGGKSHGNEVESHSLVSRHSPRRGEGKRLPCLGLCFMYRDHQFVNYYKIQKVRPESPIC